MSPSLNLLVIEDVEADYLLLKRHLQHTGLAGSCTRVSTQRGLTESLERGVWDVVLSDYKVPGMNFRDSLASIRERLPDVPVILVSGSIGEDEAVELLREGVSDFVLKDRLARLVPAIERSLEEARQRHARQASEQALRESEERLRLTLHAAGVVAWELDVASGRIRETGPVAVLFGQPEGFSHADSAALAESIHPEDRARFVSELDAAVRSGTAYGAEFRIVLPDGNVRWVSVAGEFLRDAGGRPVRLLGIARDVTERRQAEAALRQAQKMEAVGQLTGGIAHDFNNLLTVILGNLQMLEEQVAGAPLPVRLAEAAHRAARRGADLTRKLLAFSRRQMLQPEDINLGPLLTGLSDMLRRTLGENIEVVTRTDPATPAAFADPGQVENALLNFALNARDAMPRGGRLTLCAGPAHLDADYVAREAGVTPGDYALLSVSDTGTGMTPEVVARAFDPFFTTKEPAKGSGLGLAMAYGFARQSGGHVKIYSEVGHGTTIKLYLPIATASGKTPTKAVVQEHPRGHEVVLVVEDDEPVREIAVRFLGDLGYTVLEAGDARRALDLLERDRRIALLFSDVILPGGMTGPELAREAHRRRPELKTLYASGYARNAIQTSDDPDTGGALLPKPYTRDQLARAVRYALDGTDP